MRQYLQSFGVLANMESLLFQFWQIYTIRMDRTIYTYVFFVKTILFSVKAVDKTDERKKHKLPFY